MVTNIQPGPMVTVTTSAGVYRAKSIVITAGPWANRLLAHTGLQLPLEVLQSYTCSPVCACVRVCVLQLFTCYSMLCTYAESSPPKCPKFYTNFHLCPVYHFLCCCFFFFFPLHFVSTSAVTLLSVYFGKECVQR